MQKITVLVFLIAQIITLPVFGQQSATLSGVVTDGEEGLPHASVRLPNLEMGTVTDEEGNFSLKNIPLGKHLVEVRMVGYQIFRLEINLEGDRSLEEAIMLSEDLINLDQVVVTGTRSEVPLFDAPVIVSQIHPKTFEATQSLTLSEGLNFSPGLRLENNCQNCGFTQVRMNGLEGAYSQILINSRPVFSALTGVYGLDMLPANMIDRVEVVRGGGSALYGGNAIAGTINIITKDPIKNSFEVGYNQAAINGEAADRAITFNGTLVSDDLEKGISFYAFNRDRDHWDANGDGFSEITELKNTTVGFDAFWNPSDLSKIKVNGYAINEFRRGGSQFDLPPHQTDITEQLDHRILGGAASYELFSKDRRHKISVYTSAQGTLRNSYYGGGGRVLQPGDALTEDDLIALNAYGNSQDLTFVGGAQYAFNISKAIGLTVGSEYQLNDVEDEMPGYGRLIEQQVKILGNYAQLEIAPTHKWSFLLGGRFDHIAIDGLYDLEAESFNQTQTLQVFVPRLTAMYEIEENLKFRASFAQGYRAPQAFDEDLHIEVVGGAALFTRLSPDLVTERSNSFTASLNYTKTVGNLQANLVAEGFLTQLNNPFITANQQELPSGVAVVTKRNGDGAAVKGVNLEANLAFSDQWVIQSGFTVQTAQFEVEEEIWAPETPNDANADSVVTTGNLLRTPDAYGFYSINFQPSDRWQFSYSGVFTGPMEVAHMIDPETEYTIIKNTPALFEQNLRFSYTLPIQQDARLEFFGGVQNLFNSFQDDFDRGAERDPGYVFGPSRPRTFFAGVKFGL